MLSKALKQFSFNSKIGPCFWWEKGKKRFIFALFRIFHINVSVSPWYFGGRFLCFCFTGKIIRDFFLMVGKYISQLLKPFKLHIRKRLGTRTLFILFSPFLSCILHVFGGRKWKERGKDSGWKPMHYWRNVFAYFVPTSFEKFNIWPKYFFFFYNFFCQFIAEEKLQ